MKEEEKKKSERNEKKREGKENESDKCEAAIASLYSWSGVDLSINDLTQRLTVKISQGRRAKLEATPGDLKHEHCPKQCYYTQCNIANSIDDAMLHSRVSWQPCWRRLKQRCLRKSELTCLCYTKKPKDGL